MLARMGARSEVWASRVAEWRSSGLTSPAFCEGKGFSAGGLRHWAHRLSRPARGRKDTVRLARVVRRTAIEPAVKISAAETGAAVVADAIVMEIGGVRIAVRPGFDRATLARLLEVLAAAARGSR